MQYTLTDLYNTRPTWLENAHEGSMSRSSSPYAWSPDLSDEEVLQNLLALNLERSEGGLHEFGLSEQFGQADC
jgi:hypothetical protein